MLPNATQANQSPLLQLLNQNRQRAQNLGSQRQEQQQLENEYKNLYLAEAQRLNQLTQSKYAGVTPEQYAAVLNDPKYADYLKYAPMGFKDWAVPASSRMMFGAPDASRYTPALIQGWANQYANVGDPIYIPKNLTAQSLEFYKQHPEYLGVGVKGPLGSILNLSFPALGQPSAQTPTELRKQYDALLKDPSVSTEIAFKKAFSQPWEGAPKAGTKVPEYGGAVFHDFRIVPKGITSGHGEATAYGKRIAQTPGAGLIAIGIDPRDPNAEAKAQAWVDYHRARGTGFWQQGSWGNKFGRKDARMPGFDALRKQYPDAPIMAIVDAVARQNYAQNALPPRGIDLGPIGDILTPIVQIAAGAINPFLGAAIGGTLGGLQGGPLGAIIGGAGGYGMGNIGSSLATKGLEGTLSSAWQGAKDFFSSPVSNLSKPFTATDWWTPETAVNAISYVPMPKQDRGYAEGGEVSLPPDLAKYADSPHSDIEQLTNMLRRSNLRAEAVPSMSQSVRQRHMAEIGRMEEPSMAARLGVDLGGIEPYAVIDPARRAIQELGATLYGDIGKGHGAVSMGRNPEAAMDILSAMYERQLGKDARMSARFNRVKSPYGGDVGGMLSYEREF